MDPSRACRLCMKWRAFLLLVTKDGLLVEKGGRLGVSINHPERGLRVLEKKADELVCPA